ncbi:hypothetical protein [Methylocaldum sp. 14B]|jgi:hypothetical protein|uniref:hypothetical protein n=1 Tax=Methylocaldum sp. 14B TaxID=1912213 RepID=UPI00098B015D|nr:hypothetical protein [Methylocaldum sp. 14B]
MADKEIGTVESQAGKYRVLWNDRSGKVYVKKMAAFLAGWERCDATARTAANAVDVAAAYVRSEG